ncbi:MAG TPA: response regulator transcription factor [Lacunisphaera sp.]|nr:response regulator transcription factor [Lacunisphaera sp.]
MSAPPAPLLLIDDDESVRLSYGGALRAAGYALAEAADGEEGLARIEELRPELILLDVDMPRRNGWETLETLRRRGHHQPVVMLTGATETSDKVRGLGAGADDYLCKPCDKRELLARVNAILRRSRPPMPALPTLRFGATTVDLPQRQAWRGDQPVALTRTEFALLELFARHAGRPLTREFLLEKIWGYDSGVNTRTLDTHIWRLRRKLGEPQGAPRWLTSVTGGGYRLDSAATESAAD